ncbi:MAG: hypothetical protein ABIJ96_04000 [Elusimicrobiota bacterium]
MRRAALLLPWAVLAVVFSIIVMDQLKTGKTYRINIDAMRATSTQVPAGGGVAVDPVCGMEVRRKTADRVLFTAQHFFFCSTYCRELFVENPAAYAANPAKKESHLMRGIPTWMYQTGIAAILLVSFGLLQIISLFTGRSSAGVIDARVDLTASAGIRRLLKWPPLIFCLRAVTSAAFILIIAAGLFGSQNPLMNLTPLLTWTIWWAGLIFAIMYFGKAWCTICPWDAIAVWLERLKFWGPRGDSLGLGLRWPPALRNIWPAVGLFLLLTWIELGMGVTLIPRATAWIALGMLGLAVVSMFIFERKAFCRYGCLVGRVSGLYALFAPIEVRSDNDSICAGCRTMDCYRGSSRGDGCPTFEYPRAMSLNTYCTLCTECFKTCPHDNMAIRLRPWAADLAQQGRPRTDEAIMALVLLSMTSFHGLTMTPVWGAINESMLRSWGLPYLLSFSLLMAGILLGPIAVYTVLVWASAWLSGEVGFKRIFLSYAYAMLPIALFYHLAHNAEHFLMEGPKVLRLISDPFGWGWNLFGTTAWSTPPMITLEGLWWIQLFFIIIGHIYGLWISERTTRRLIADPRTAFLTQLPMLTAMVAFSVLSLWLLNQPMEMRLSAM